ncbi:unnamed protein product [Porites lobata]|uniref:Uncharacterized protein n=1 Tax=Porites lobata TaxID=104759 RepID=A0ABN8NH47_9CNID|nr:unnamed protein product [Porites lobata]
MNRGEMTEEMKFRAEVHLKKVVTVGEGEHPLQCPHAFWFSRRPQGKP